MNGGPPVGTRPAWEQKNLESDLELIQKTRISEFQQLQKIKKKVRNFQFWLDQLRLNEAFWLVIEWER